MNFLIQNFSRQRNSLQNDLFGGLDAHRVQFIVGRNIRIASMGEQTEPLNYFINRFSPDMPKRFRVEPIVE